MRHHRGEQAATRTPSIGSLPARPSAVSLLLLAGSFVLWVVSLGSIDVGQIGDVGLISVLPASFFAALLLLTASFGVTLAGRQIRWLLMLQLAVLVLVLFGTPSFVEYGPRTQSAWRLAGVVDYISLHHSVNLAIDAFFNWPGFFILESFLTRAGGLSTPLAFARWAPLFFNLLYALPLALIFRRLSLSTRQVWLGLWLFFAANWVGQDYLAPQAFGYFVYLTIISLILTVFPAGPVDLSLAGTLRLSARARTGLVALVLVLYALIVPSHQLTPWVLVFALAALAVVRRLPSPGLPLLFCLMAATWVAFFAGPFLSGNFANLVSPIGSVGSNVNANLGSRFVGNSGHLFVVRLRVVFSLAIGLLGLLGLLRLRRQGASIRILVALSIAPAVALVLQTYGGELSLRVFFLPSRLSHSPRARHWSPHSPGVPSSSRPRPRRFSSPSASAFWSRDTGTRRWTHSRRRKSPRYNSCTGARPAEPSSFQRTTISRGSSSTMLITPMSISTKRR